MPVVAMVTAVIWLREPVGFGKIAGATLVLAGVALTRVGKKAHGSGLMAQTDSCLGH